jgi:hypothetical protein
MHTRIYIQNVLRFVRCFRPESKKKKTGPDGYRFANKKGRSVTKKKSGPICSLVAMQDPGGRGEGKGQERGIIMMRSRLRWLPWVRKHRIERGE